MAAASAEVCDRYPYSILLKVQGVKRPDGYIIVDVHGDDPAAFMKSGAKLVRIQAPADAPSTSLCIPLSRPGVYALVLYHDRNGDLEFNKNWLGLPKEPFGISNNPPLRMAKPKHEQAAFRLEKGMITLTIMLRSAL